MPAFAYKAIDSLGNVRNGTSPAQNEADLTQILKAQGLFLMDARLAAPAIAPIPNKKKSMPALIPTMPLKPNAKVPLDRIAIFTTEFAVMVRTALPIDEALTSLARQQSHPAFKSVLSDIAQQVQKGIALSDAFARFPRVFGPVYISLLRAGEASGTIAIMLERVMNHLQFQRELKAKVRSAMIYPLIVISTTMVVVLFLVLFILPHFATIFAQMDARLPWPTQALLDVSETFRNYWWIILLAIGGAWAAVARWLSHAAHIEPWEIAQLRMPVVGPLIRNIVMTRILRTLGALVSSGVPILQALELARESADNIVFEKLFKRVQDNVSRGQGIASALYDSPYFPESVANMIANAELTGTLPEVLNKVADYYEQETDTSLKNLFALIEPLFVVVLGLAVAGIAIAMLLPIFKLDAAIS
jgi:type IV pilus assembly protein PilC